MMKATGIVRKVDELGRIVIPIELRRTLGISVKDQLEIFVDGDKIILGKYHAACKGCGTVGVPLQGDPEKLLLCDDCIKKFYQNNTNA